MGKPSASPLCSFDSGSSEVQILGAPCVGPAVAPAVWIRSTRTAVTGFLKICTLMDLVFGFSSISIPSCRCHVCCCRKLRYSKTGS